LEGGVPYPEVMRLSEKKFMPQTMTLDEKLAISNKAFTLLEAGDRDISGKFIAISFALNTDNTN
jgi:hypothetical protein